MRKLILLTAIVTLCLAGEAQALQRIDTRSERRQACKLSNRYITNYTGTVLSDDSTAIDSDRTPCYRADSTHMIQYWTAYYDDGYACDHVNKIRLSDDDYFRVRVRAIRCYRADANGE
jgi:hypothetical protein